MIVPKNKLKIDDFIVKYPFTILKICYIIKLTKDFTVVMSKIIRGPFRGVTCKTCFNRSQCELYHKALPYLSKPVDDSKFTCEMIYHNAKVIPKLRGLLYESISKSNKRR